MPAGSRRGACTRVFWLFMDSTDDSPAPGRFGALRQRSAAAVLALIVEGLIVLLFLAFTTGLVRTKKPIPTIFGFDVADEGAAETRATDTKQAKSDKRTGRRESAAVPPPPQPSAPKLEEPQPPQLPSNVIWLTRREFAEADVGKVRAVPGDTAADAAGAGPARSALPDSEIVGRGPKGEPLYAAEWYREPSDAELGTYLPPGRRQSGWGLVACRTIAGYRVEDCQELGESPRGSGFGRSVRQAAWQFRVRPPRVGGRYQTGTWVQIRISYGFREE